VYVATWRSPRPAVTSGHQRTLSDSYAHIRPADWGSRGRGFKSRQPDTASPTTKTPGQRQYRRISMRECPRIVHEFWWTVVDTMLVVVKGSVRPPRNPAGTWAYRIDVPAKEGQARRQVQMAGFGTQAEARAGLAAAIDEYELDLPVRRAPDTVGGFLSDRWLRGVRREVAESALTNYATLMNAYVVDRIGDVHLTHLTTTQVNQLYVDLLAGGAVDGRPLSPTSVLQVHRTLRRALNDAVRWGLVDRNVAVDAKVPKPAGRTFTVWTPEQSASFLASVVDDRLYVLWVLALHTGMSNWLRP
jgi:hypothetical protein